MNYFGFILFLFLIIIVLCIILIILIMSNDSSQQVSCLFLGMANTAYDDKIFMKKQNKIYGQVRRDSIRLKRFSSVFNSKCYTIDNKHDDLINKHVYGNFNNPRRLDKRMKDIFKDHPIFKWIFLDYFFSPVVLFKIIIDNIIIIYYY